MSQTLPQGFQLRRPTMDDLKAVHNVIDKSDLAYLGSSDVTLEELRTDWLAPEFNLQQDAWLLVGPAGQIVGYALVIATGEVHAYVATPCDEQNGERGCEEGENATGERPAADAH